MKLEYSRADLGQSPVGSAAEGTRRDVATGNGSLTERGLAIAEVVKAIAAERGTSPSRVALSWLLGQAGVAAPVLGVRTLAQLEDNLAAMAIVLSEEEYRRLDEASTINLGFPHEFLAREMTRAIMTGGLTIERR